MSVMIFGKDGQVGTELRRQYPQARALGRADCDASDVDAVREAVRAANPTLIFNAIAYNLTEQAEREPDAAHALNARLPQVLAEEALRCNALLVHYSTDYVFDGHKPDPYVETDPTAPLNAYARSKLAGEDAVRAVGGHHLIFRTAWVFSPHRTNFAKTILAKARTLPTLHVNTDQIGTPTAADAIAEASLLAAETFTPDQSGIYHLVCPCALSRYDYAVRLIEAARRARRPLACREVVPTTTPTDAAMQRPARVVLSTDKLQRTFDITLPDVLTPQQLNTRILELC